MKKLSIITVAGLVQFACFLNVQAAETLFSETFDLVSTGDLPADWSVNTNASTSVTVSEVPDASDKSLQLDDADASDSVEAWVSFSEQQGPIVASWAFMETGGTTAGEGHHMALLAGDRHAVELFTVDGNLVYRDLDGTDHVLQAVSKDIWYDVDVAADPTHFTADVYVGGVLKLEGASFQHTTTRLNGILFGSSDAWADDSLYVNDITISKADLILDENFNAMTTDTDPTDWQVNTNTDTAVSISETPSTTNKSMRITDANSSGFSEVWKSFDQMDRPFTASWNFMLTGNEEGHRMQLLSDTNVVFELATDSAGTLRYTRPSSTGYDLGVPTPNVWHEISVTLNLAARKADVYMDGVLKWSHRELLNTSVSYIDRVLFGSSDVTDQYDLYVDDVTIDADPVYVITPLDVSTPRLPIVLKLDDLSGYSLWWQRATDFAADRQLSISPGIFGNTLGSATGTYLSYLQGLYSDPSVEIFLHAYDHVDPEFQGTDYTYQKNHVEWTQAAAESTLGSRLTVFGASFNKTDTNTVQVLSEDSDIKIWLFCDQADTAGKTPLYRVAGVNIEESTFIPDPEAFVTGYKANADANDYFVIQGHPNNWTDARWYNYVRLIDFLEDNDIPTMTPSALVSMLSGPDTTAPSAPTNVAAVAGDNTVFLDWDDNSESDLDCYTVYRSTTSGSGYGVLASNLTVSACEDSSAVNGTTYYYIVTATDTSTNESPTSTEVFATPAVDITAPAAPTGLAAAAGNSAVSLDWDDNAELDLAGYTVYRSTTSGSGYSVLASNLTSSAYGDSSAVNGVTYYYVVTATDVSDNESATSTEVSATPVPPSASEVGYWRFEGGTAGNAIITAADSSGNGLDGEQWSSNVTNVLYSADVAGAYIYDPLTSQTNANTGSMVATGTAAEENSQIVVHGMSGQVAGSWTLEMFVKAETDGGVALFAGGSNNRLVQFDGSLICQVNVGANGDASSTYVKFRLDSTTIQNYSSVFLDGTWHHLAYVADYDSGTTNTTITIYKDFENVASTTVSGEFSASGDLRFGISGVYNGMSNIDWFIDDVRLSDGVLATNEFLQVAEAPSADTTPPAAPTGLSAVAGESMILLDWDDNAESDLAGYTVYRSTVSGSGYSVLASNLTVSACEDSSAAGDTTYYYVVTATDTSTNESVYSTEVSASIQTQTQTNNLLTTINVQDVVVLTGGTTQSGTVYRLQYTEQLGTDTWTTLPFYFEGGDTNLFFIDPANISTQRYYRLIEE